MNTMKKAGIGLCLCGLALSQSAFAMSDTVRPHENLLNNPTFDCSTDALPYDWNLSYEAVRPFLTVGEDGQGRYVEFHPSTAEAVLKQDDMHLVPGADYRVGAWVRSKGLKTLRGGIVITSWAWASDGGPSIPSDTQGEWVCVEKTVKAPASHNETYNMVIYAVGMSAGELAVRNPFVEPVDERAADGALRAPRPSELNVITPVSPLLQKIPAGDSPLLLACRARKDPTTCVVSVRFDGETAERSQGEFGLCGERVFARLKGLPEDRRGELRLCLRSGGRIVAESKYEIRTLPKAKLSYPPERDLNGLVTRLLTASAKVGEHSFSMPEDGWVYVSLEKGDERTFGCLDGDVTPVLRWRDGERFETMRKLKKGDHFLRLSGKPEGRLLVNRIPELFCDSYPAPNLKSYAFVTDEFRRRHIYSAFNVYCYGWSMDNVPKPDWEDFKERGKSLMCQDVHWRPYIAGWTNRYESAEALSARLHRNSEGMSAFYDGTCFDEVDIFCTREKWIYAQAARKLADLTRPFYTWSSRVRFSDCPLNAEYLSACLNASRGNGKFMFECYPHYSAKSETALRDYLDEYLDDTIRRGKVLSPCLNPNAMIVMGLYSDMCGSISYDDAGRCDPKRLIDLYVRSLVTRREFRGLGGFGIYAYHNASEEDVRWISFVVRHYLIEGNSECLSDRLGIVWDPGIIVNGDFSKGLSGWRIESTGTNMVFADKLDGFGKGVLKRDRAGRDGDCGCVFKLVKGGTNSIRQVLRNLKPGRTYSVRYVVAPVKAYREKAEGIWSADIVAEVRGAEVITDEMPVRKYGCVERRGKYCVQRTLVFRANSSEAELVFSCARPKESVASDDDELFLSSVRVRPYLREAKTLPLGAGDADPAARVRQIGDGVCTVGEIVTGAVLRVDFRLSPEPGSDIRCRIELPPAARWDGRMWGVGNSGWAGSFLPISQFSAWGTAVVTTDLGTAAYTENGKSNEKVWPDCVRRDYDWRATHLMTVYAKRIVEAYYGRPPSRCYFDGGSCGGRQGIGEAIRFPEDYDGVIAHMPGNNPICNEVDDFILWKLTHDEAGKLLFTEDEMHVVSDAAVAYGASRTERPFSGKVLADPFFTADDVDGFLSLAAEKAPRLADPDLRSRLRRLFLGTEHRGRRMTYGKIPGSYLGDEMRRTWHAYFPQFLRNRGLTRATATLDDLDEFVRLYAPTYNACSDDLEAFRLRGGKLIVTPGLEDQTDPPRVQIAHFERVVSRLGGDLSAALSFYRVFPVPGCAHGGGKGRVITIPPDGPAVWRQMIDWREKGVAPERFMVPWKDEGVDISVAPYPKRLVQDDRGNWIERTFDRSRMPSVDPLYLQCETRLSGIW